MKIVVMTPKPSTLLQMVASQHQLIGVACDDAPAGGVTGMAREGWHCLCRAPSLQSWARLRRIPYRCYISDQADDFASWLAQLEPDLLITCKAPLLPESVFSIPRLGAINIHYALLPNYRGGAPLLWQVVNGEQQGGVTVHYIDAGIDTGAIIRQRTVPFPQGASERQLDKYFGNIAADMMPEVLEAVAAGYAGKQAEREQPDGVFARNIQQASLVDFIEWDDWPIEKIWRVLRFMEYWPASHGLEGRWQRSIRWKVGEIRAASEAEVRAWYLQRHGRHLLVQSRQGNIELLPERHMPTLLRGVAEAGRLLVSRCISPAMP